MRQLPDVLMTPRHTCHPEIQAFQEPEKPALHSFLQKMFIVCLLHTSSVLGTGDTVGHETNKVPSVLGLQPS